MSLKGKYDLLLVGSTFPWAIENIFAKYLGHVGHKVSRFNLFHKRSAKRTLVNRLTARVLRPITDQQKNRELIQFVKQTKPTIVLVVKGSILFPETIQQLSLEVPLVVNYNPDHPFIFAQPQSKDAKNIRNSVGHYHLYVHYAKSVVKDLNENHDVNAVCVPFGYDHEKAAELNGYQTLDPSMIFAGAWDKEREQFLSDLSKVTPIKIYGSRDWKSKVSSRSPLKEAYQSKMLIDDEYVTVSRKSFGMLNILRGHNLAENSHNMRTFEVTGYGGAMFAQRTDEHEQFFEDDKEAVFFDSPEELHEKISFYNQKPALINKIKEAALLRSKRSGYSYLSRMEQLSEHLMITLS